MKKSPSLLLVLSIILFIGCQCKKSVVADNPYGLPNATQTGANTFACLINGKKFISQYNPSNGTGATFKSDTLGISGAFHESNANYEYIGFQINRSIILNSAYNISSNGTYAILTTFETCAGLLFNQTTSYASSGNIILIKFDTTKKIVSGTFTLDFPIPNCDTLHVTEGRFDYQYY